MNDILNKLDESLVTLKEILNELKNKKIEKQTLSLAECVDFTGICREKLTEIINKKDTDFPYFKNGTKTLVNKNLLIEWLDKISKENRQL
jgi:hypothetical protein